MKAFIAGLSIVLIMAASSFAGDWIPSRQMRAEASSVLAPSKVATYIPENVIDGNTSTCWVEGAAGHGIKEWIQIHLPRPMTVTKISILNGYNKPGGSFKKNSRVKRATILLSEEDINHTITLKDSQKFQTFSFPPTLTNYVMLFIESVYPGDKWTDTCISEIKVFAE